MVLQFSVEPLPFRRLPKNGLRGILKDTPSRKKAILELVQRWCKFECCVCNFVFLVQSMPTLNSRSFNFNKVIVVFSALVVLSACATPGVSIDHDIELAIPNSVELSIANHHPFFPVSAELVSLHSAVTINHKWNVGPVGSGDHRQSLAWEANGRLISKTSNIVRTPDGSGSAIVSTSASLCGLVPLVMESASQLISKNTTIAPIAGGVIPLDFSNKYQMVTRSKITSFNTSAPNLCRPAAGKSFAYQLTRLEQRKFEGKTLSSNKLHMVKEDVECHVGNKELLANTLDSSLIGNYLAVDCAYTESSKPVRKSKFAYLTSSALFVPLVVELNEYETHESLYKTSKYK
jgi:hypothetical protein